MAAYTWGNALQIVTLFFWFAALIMLALSSVSIDYPPYEAKVDKIVNNPGDITACENEALLGDTSCVTDFYTSRAWKTWQWWVLYFTLVWTLLETFFVVLYLMLQKRGWAWFLMVPFLALGTVWLVTVIIQTTVYWVNCEDYSACTNARFEYDFTGEVKHHVADWWIVHMVAYYVLFLCHIALFFLSIATQACLSRAVNGRETGLDPLFTPEDRKTVDRANSASQSGLINSSVDADGADPLPADVRASLRSHVKDV